ncbi:hypothetical protein R6Q59_009317, partial [Mikania micrantha]
LISPVGVVFHHNKFTHFIQYSSHQGYYNSPSHSIQLLTKARLQHNIHYEEHVWSPVTHVADKIKPNCRPWLCSSEQEPEYKDATSNRGKKHGCYNKLDNDGMGRKVYRVLIASCDGVTFSDLVMGHLRSIARVSD